MQAFVIAIPSDFIPKTLYYYWNDRSMDNYIDYAYSYSPVAGNSSASNCYYAVSW